MDRLFEKICSFTIICLSASFSIIAKADICNPHDPEGLNPNTLCIKHYHQNYGNQYFINGTGSTAYQGKSNDFRYPGKQIIKSPLKNDFFTSVSTGDKSNGILIKTNKGNVYSFQSN